MSVLSYLVEQRKKEIGVRMALGASPRDIVTLVVSQSMRPIAIGVVLGGGLAAVTASVLLSMPASGWLPILAATAPCSKVMPVDCLQLHGQSGQSWPLPAAAAG